MRSTRIVLAFFLASAAVAAAQTPGAAAVSGASASGGVGTVAELFRSCGWLGWVLCALSVLALSVACWLAATMRRGFVAPMAVVNDVMDDIRRGDLEAARKACDYKPCAFSRVAMASIDAARGLGPADAATIAAVAEGEGTRQASKLQSRAQWLLDIASIAPMVGLLGTVLGMFEAFRAVGGEFSVAAKPVILAQGVALALVTTVAGLIVAIPCMALYALFRRSAARQAAFLEAVASDLVVELAAARKI